MGKARSSRNKHRGFRGNQSVSESPKKGNGVAAKSGGKEIPSVSKQQPATPTEGIRSRKIKSTQINEENIDKDDYYICINFSVLQKLFMEVALCPIGQEQIHILDDLSSRMGLAHKLILSCKCVMET